MIWCRSVGLGCTSSTISGGDRIWQLAGHTTIRVHMFEFGPKQLQNWRLREDVRDDSVYCVTCGTGVRKVQNIGSFLVGPKYLENMSDKNC
jgi:hypothetical protein